MPHIPTTDFNASNLKIGEFVNPNTPGEGTPQFEELSDESLQYIVGGAAYGCVSSTSTLPDGSTVTTKICGPQIKDVAASFQAEMIGADTSEITRI